jgi:hypothetical protein
MNFSSRIIFTAVVGGIIWFARHTAQQSETSHYQPIVEQALTSVSNGNDAVCLREPALPYDTTVQRATWSANAGNKLRCYPEYRPHCDDCEDLTQAGLLTRTRIDASMGTPAGVRYELSDKGRALYRNDIHNPDAHGQDQCIAGAEQDGSDLPAMHYQPGFCFAESTRLYRVDETLSPFKNGTHMMIGVKFTREAVNPDPMLFDPAIQRLLHDAPAPGTPALFKPQTGTVMVDHNNPPEYDPGMQVGKFAVGP